VHPAGKGSVGNVSPSGAGAIESDDSSVIGPDTNPATPFAAKVAAPTSVTPDADVAGSARAASVAEAASVTVAR
jgi:hypothetical protein